MLEKQFVVEDYRDILMNLYQLAGEDRAFYASKHRGEENFVDLSDIEPEDIIEDLESRKTFQFLRTLDEDQIKVVQTVMYIGRDYEVPAMSDEEQEEFFERKAEDPYYERPKQPLKVANPNAYLTEEIKALGRTKGWESRSIEINIIEEKLMLLPDYLWRGFKILGLVAE